MGSRSRDSRAPLAGARSFVVWSFILLAVLAAAPPTVVAGGGADPPPGLCEPVAVACALGEGPDARDARLARIVGEIDRDLAAHGASDRARYLEAVRRAAPARDAMRASFERLRTIARAMVQSGRGPRPLDREAALARLDAAELRWPEAEAFARDPSAPHQRAFVRGCGPTAMLDEAWVSNDRTGVVLCPGFVLLELDRAEQRPEIAADAAAFLLAHELGHVLEDSADDPPSERAADAWAREITAEYVHARAAEGADASKVIARTLSSFCDLPPGDPLHGDGTERARAAAADWAGLVCREGARPATPASAMMPR